MRRFLQMYKVEQKIFFRSPDVILFCLAMPLIVFLVITMISGGKNAADTGLTYMQSSYVALSTVGICCSVFMSIPITIVELRSKGILRRMYCNPCSPVRLLACDTICSGVIAAVSTLLLTAVSVTIFGYRMEGNILLYIAMWLLNMISMFSIGLMAAGLCRTEKSMNVVTSVLYFPMLLFSGATIPAEVFPEGIRVICEWLPLGVGIRVLKSVSQGCYDKIMIPVLVFLGITPVCGLIAIKTFRWE